MNIKPFTLFVILVLLHTDSIASDNSWKTKFLDYIKMNKPSKYAPNISFKKDGLYFFDIYNLSKQEDNGSTHDDWSALYLEEASSRIGSIVREKHCKQRSADIIMDFIEINKNKDIIQIEYSDSVYTYEYSTPLLIDDCKLFIIYEQKMTQSFPATGEGFIHVFEYNNDLKLLTSINWGYFD